MRSSVIGHMSEINPQLLKPGTKVKAGQYLGRLGNSGAFRRATPSHSRSEGQREGERGADRRL
jgi:murein DD-endopeptidase MepM/ murein hydrolase activator NlpD